MTKRVACPDPRDLERLLLGQLAEPETEALGQHLLGCAHCARVLDSLQVNDPLLACLQAGRGRVPLEDPVVDALVERCIHMPADAMSMTPLQGPTTDAPGPGGDGETMPQHVGRYQIVRRLGAGGMGVVYLAHDPQLRRDVAIKMILGGPHAGPSQLRRFRLEAEAVAAFQHPHIVQIHEIGEHQGLPYFALEFVDGGSLADQLDGTPWPVANAARFVAMLARAMQAAHERGIVHRDLKPANILLQSGGQTHDPGCQSAISNLQSAIPKITDFGLAKKLDEAGQTASGAVMGTPSYMAPEQAAGETKNVGSAADVYALGAILYECLTGRPPFRAATSLETIFLVVSTEPVAPAQFNPKLPRDLETICLKCLQKDPGKRYRAAADLAMDLGRFLNGEPIIARPVGRVERTWRWCRRYPARAWLLATLLIVLVGAGIAGLMIRDQFEEQRRANEAAGLVKTLLKAETAQVPGIIDDIEKYRPWADPLLRDAHDNAAADSKEKLHASLALLPVDPGQAAYLYDRLLEAAPAEVPVIRDALVPHQEALFDKLWAAVEKPGKEGQRLRAAAALARFAPQSEKWTKGNNTLVVDDLVQEDALFLGQWSEAFRPVQEHLLRPLSAIFRDPNPERIAERKLATNLLADYAAGQPHVLADLLMDADEKQFALMFRKFKEHGSVDDLLAEIEKVSEDDKEKLAKRQANAAVALLKINQPEKVWRLLKHSSDPRLRSYLIDRIHPLGVDAGDIVKRLHEEGDLSIRRALLLSLGEYREKQMAAADRQTVLAKAKKIYGEEADPGLHAAAEWLLGSWGEKDWLIKINGDWTKDGKGRAKKIDEIMALVAKEKDKARPRWYVDGKGHTMVVIPGPVVFMMGSLPTEKERDTDEAQHKRRIGRTFALASKPVSLEQYWLVEKGYGSRDQKIYTRSGELPVFGIDWYRAAKYCNWLSQQEEIPEEDWSYEIKGNEVKLRQNYLSLAGYRLPTEAEMEYATRAGATTTWHYGATDELLHKYAWYDRNSKEKTWPVGSLRPNDLGLFDMHGNVYTWCQDRAFPNYPIGKGGDAVEDVEDKELIVRDTYKRVMRGGSFTTLASFGRSAFRNRDFPRSQFLNYGFRVARTLPLGSFTRLPLKSLHGSRQKTGGRVGPPTQ